MTIEGKLVEKYDTQEVSGSFRKREFVVEYAENPQYPEFLKLELIQSNCQQLDDFQVGDQVQVSFNLKGRRWVDPSTQTPKYFNTLQAWRLERRGTSTPPPTPEPNEPWMQPDFSSDEDLPF